jgi:hypothetical protein
MAGTTFQRQFNQNASPTAVAAALGDPATKVDWTGGKSNADPGKRSVLSKVGTGAAVDVLDYISDTSHATIAAGTNTNDLTTNIQNAINDAQDDRRECLLPHGVCYVTSINVATPTRQTVVLRGRGRGYVPGTGQALTRSESVLKGTSTTLPVLVLNQGRSCIIDSVGIIGPNAAPVSVTEPLQSAATYLTGGVSGGRYNAQAGIALDPYGGTDPGGGTGYAGQTYTGSANGCSDITLRRVNIRECVVGILNNPSSSGQQGDAIRIVDSQIKYCRDGYAAGCSQSNMVSMDHLNIGPVHTIIDGYTYGQQQGAMPMIGRLTGGPAYRFMNVPDGFKPGMLEFISLESVKSVGNYGAGVTTSKFPLVINFLQFHAREDYTNPSVCFINYGDVLINGSEWQVNAAASPLSLTGVPWNFGGTGDLILNNARFLVRDVYKPFLGYSAGFTKSMSGINWRMEDTAGRVAKINRGGSSVSTIPNSPSPATNRAIVHPSNLLYPGIGKTYDITLTRFDTTLNQAGNSGWAYNSGASRVTFTPSATSLWQVGDIIFSRITSLGSALTDTVPCLEVESVSATVTLKMTGSFDFAQLDQTYLPTTISMACAHWATAVAFAGTTTGTNTSPLVTACTADPATVLRVGDWFNLVGGFSVSRVLTIDSATQFTAQNNATSAQVGQKISFAKLSVRALPTDAF